MDYSLNCLVVGFPSFGLITHHFDVDSRKQLGNDFPVSMKLYLMPVSSFLRLALKKKVLWSFYQVFQAKRFSKRLWDVLNSSPSSSPKLAWSKPGLFKVAKFGLLQVSSALYRI